MPAESSAWLVESHNVPLHLARVYRMNTEKSPLLSLSAELRTRIWEFVFTGYKIHGWPSKDHPLKICCSCRLGIDGEKEARDMVNPETDKHDHYLVRHQKCVNPEKAEEEPRGSHLFGIHALGVCRQIHSEASLLPFSKNEFSFRNGTQMNRFLGHLKPEQVRAIHLMSVVLRYLPETGYKDRYKLLMPDLKRVVFFLEMNMSLEAKEEYSPPNIKWAEAMRTFPTRQLYAMVAPIRIIPDNDLPTNNRSIELQHQYCINQLYQSSRRSIRKIVFAWDYASLEWLEDISDLPDWEDEDESDDE